MTATITPTRIQDQLQDVIHRHAQRVDYLEIRREQSESLRLGFRGTRFDAVDRGLSLAGGIRACYRGGWSFVTFYGLSELSERVQDAVTQARLIGQEVTQLADVTPVVDYVTASIAKDPRTVPLSEKRELLNHYNNLLLQYDSRIQTTSVGYRERFGITYLATSTGTLLAQERLDVSGMFGVVARGAEMVVRQGYESVHSRSDYNVLVGIEDQVLGAAQRAVRQLEAQPVKGGQYTVILDPYLAGVFIHEAFGHLSEADFVYENPRMQELLQLGRQVAIPELNVVDDATLPGLPGSLVYDDEGVPGQRKYLIKDGVLTQRLHSRETAGLVVSHRGAQGGYRLARPPELIRVSEIFLAVGESLTYPEPQPQQATDWVTRTLWRRLSGVCEQALQSLTLADLYYDVRSRMATDAEAFHFIV